MDGAKDKDTPTLMQLKCPPEVETKQNATTEVTQTLPQLKDPPVFETWQHGTPDATLTLLLLEEAPEIDTLLHATTSSIASQLKDDNDYNSCVEWAVAAASAGCDAECDSYTECNFEPLAADRLKKPAAKATNDNVYEDDELFQDDTPEDNVEEDMEYHHVNSKGRWGCSLSSGGPPRPDTSGMSAAKAQKAIKEWRVLCKANTDKMQREHRMLFGSKMLDFGSCWMWRFPIVEWAYLPNKGDTINPNRRRSQLLWLSDCHCLKQQLPGICPGLCRILVPD